MPSRRHSSAMLSSPRRPSSTMRIFSSAENCRRVARRRSLTTPSAGCFTGPDFCFIDCKRLRNFLPASLLKWMAHIGEISADGIDQPLRALPERVAKHFSATVHLATVGLAPLRQRVDAPGHGPLADAGRADLDAVEDLGELADHARIGNDRAEAVARDAVGLREAVELDGVIAPCAALEEPMRAIQRRRQEVAIGLVDDEPESAPAAKVRNVLDDAIRVDRAGGLF